MKTLKKTLCVVLALVMAVGMLTIPANAAADYKDDEEITHNEAVEVLTALGILEGDETTGKFDPQGKLTREGGAKLAVVVPMTPTNASYLPTTGSKFADIKDGRWSAGYIAYAEAQGIVTGVSSTKFNPKGTLTYVELAKMLLVVLNNETDYELKVDVEGRNWVVNTAMAAHEVGLDNELTISNYNATISRDDAAQMVLNAMNYTKSGEVVGYSVNVTSGTDGAKVAGIVFASRAEAALYASVILDETDTYTIDPVTNNNGSILYETYGITRTVGAENDYGQKGVQYANARGTFDLFFATGANKEYTTTVTAATIYADLGLKADVNATNTKVTVNGNGTESATSSDTKQIQKNGTDTFGGNGVLTQVYLNADGSVSIVEIHTYAGKISAHTPASTGVAESITIAVESGDQSGLGSQSTMTVNTSDFTDKDVGAVVLYTVLYDSTYKGATAKAATSSNVVATLATGATSFVADGKTYYYSAHKNATIADSDVTNAKTKVVYTDDAGYVIYVTDPTTAGPETHYAYVINAAEDTQGSVLDSTAIHRARLLLEDGSIKDVVTKDNETANNHKLVKYTVTDDVYDLTDEAASTADSSSELVLKKGNANMTLPGGTAKVVNNKTVFFVVADETTKPASANVYTGFSAVPTMTTAGSGTKVASIDGANGALGAVLVIAGTPDSASTSTDTYYIHYVSGLQPTTEAGVGTYYTLPAIVKGEITTVKVSATVYTGNSGSGADLHQQDQYVNSVTVDSKGIITKIASSQISTISGTGYSAAVEGVLTLDTSSSNKHVTYTDSTVVYVINGSTITKSTVADLKVDANDTIKFVADSNDVLSVLFITTVA